MDSKTLGVDKPHAVCIPYPVQSHIKAMLKFSKLLHHKDSSPPSDPNATQDIPSLCVSITKNFLASFSNLLVKLNSGTSSIPPLTCIISDGFMQFTITAAQELGIPIVMFFIIAPCNLMGFILSCRFLISRIKASFRLKDLPSFVRTIDPNDIIFKYVIETVERAPMASGIVVQTFDTLEQDVLDGFLPMFPHVYAIGPLQSLLIHLSNDPLKSIGYSLWEEETKCLHWLNSKAPNSVVYVNFGSITIMTLSQLVEFGWGLANCKYIFSWIIRPDLVVGELVILPLEFKFETKERGLIASWCLQEEVLNHPSIGGFLTHSGWNSSIESVCAGVPILCWPFFADQQTNCKYTCNDWCIGMEIDNDVKREDVEKIVRELMEREKGKKMKKKVMEWKKLAEEAIEPLGSSSINLNNLVNEVLLSKG
uniref:Glycosyltransferase n=1 Tax=Quercus lobata TaxID=97700 RepID=A0A7N2N580_QUELO